MATNVGTLLMKVDADTNKFEKGISRSQKAIQGFGKAAKIGLAAVGASIVAVTAVSVKAAQDQERAEARLASIAKTVTKATDDQVKSLKKLAAEQQKVSTFGDEVLIAGQSQLLSFGLQTDQVEQLTGSLADLLAANKGVNATQEDAINAANLLGKAFSGQAGALSRVGILLDDTQAEILKNGDASEKTAALVDILNQNYGGLAKELSTTTEGQLKQLKNTLGDVAETIGFTLLPIINKLVGFVADNIPKMQDFFSKAFNKIKNVMMIVWEFIQANLMPIFMEIVAFAQSQLPVFKNVFTEVFKRITEVAMTLWDFFKTNLLPIFITLYDWVIANMPMIKETAENVFNGILTVFDAVWKFTKDNILPILQSLFDLAQEIFPKILNIVKPVFESIISLATTLWSFFKENLLPIFEAIFKVVDATIPKLAPIFESAFGTIADIIKGLIDFFADLVNIIGKAIDKLQEFFRVKGTTADPSGSGLGRSSVGGGTFGGLSDSIRNGSFGGTTNNSNSININVNESNNPQQTANFIVNELNRQGIGGN